MTEHAMSGAQALETKPAPSESRVRAPGWGDFWLMLAVVVVAVGFQWPIARHWLALLDEGYILAIADEINRGAVLYRDVTIDNPLPGAFYLVAWWFRAIGSSVANSRILSVAGFAIYAAALFRISRELLPRGWSLGIVVLLLCYRVWAFPHWHIYSYSLVAATFVAVAAAFVFTAVRRGSSFRLFLAGLFAGGAVLSKQDYGLCVLGALGLALLILPWLRPGPRPTWRQAIGPAFALGLSSLVVIGPAIGYFAYEGALEELVKQTLIFPLTAGDRFDYTRLPSLWPLFGQDADLRAQIGSYFPSILATLWWYPCDGCWMSDMSRGWLYQRTFVWDFALKVVYWLPIFLFAAAALLWGTRLVRETRHGGITEESGRRLLLLAFAGGFLLAFNRPRDWVHVMMIYPPALLLGAALLYQTWEHLPRTAARVVGTVVCAGLALLFLTSVALMTDLRRQIDWPIKVARGGVFIDRRNGPVIDDFLTYAQGRIPEGRPLPVYPVQPMLAYLSGRRPAAGYFVIWPVQDERRDERIIADLEDKQIPFLIYSLSQYAHLRPFQANAPQLFDYLVDHYEIERVFSREAFGPLLLSLRRREPVSTEGFVRLSELARTTEGSWTSWPFGRVFTQPVGTPDDPLTVRLRFKVPREETQLFLAPGVNPDRWLGLKAGPFRFKVAARVRKKGEWSEPQTLLTQEIDPARKIEDRGWKWATVDLSQFTGRSIDLQLSIEAPESGDSPEDLAGWLDPVLVVPREKG